jgi:hypothetical protein
LFSDATGACSGGCHNLTDGAGSFGTNQAQAIQGLTQVFKIPHLRNQYTKVGMFGTPAVSFTGSFDSGFTGDQIRGFGFAPDGSIDTIFRFLQSQVFGPAPTVGFTGSDPDGTRRDVEQFLLAFDSDLAPIVGQQVTLTSANSAGAGPRIDLLLQRAGTSFSSRMLGGTVTECDVVAFVVQNGSIVGYLYNPQTGTFSSSSGSTISDANLRALAQTSGQEVTYTAATPGSGARLAFGSYPRSRVLANPIERPPVHVRGRG